jgi:hypothetical protein
VLAAGASPRTGYAHTDGADFGMTVAEFRLGRGTCLLSQLKVTRNYRTDSAAHAFGCNLLRYVLSAGAPPSDVPALAGDDGSVSDQPIIDKDQVAFIGLHKQANRTIADADGSGFMGLGQGFPNLVDGTRLFGVVPVKIRKGKAIVVGSTPARAPTFPPEIRGIGVWKPCSKLFFLHTATYVKATEGEEVMRYRIHLHRRKEPETFVVKNKVDIADWHKPKSHSNAQVVWYSPAGQGIYLAEWQNPYPNNEISRIDVVAGDKAYVGVFGISGLLVE